MAVRAAFSSQQIDMVIHVSAIKSKHYILVLEDIQQVVKACGEIPVKVIIETALLTDTEKIAACTLAKTAGAAFHQDVHRQGG
jgi:deoxyribose-phosphate aldolase